MRLTLASASPRRAELLRAAGILFDVLPVEDGCIEPIRLAVQQNFRKSRLRGVLLSHQ